MTEAEQRVRDVAASLLLQRREHDLTDIWDALCDADPLPHGRDYDDYLRDMEADDLIDFRGVERDDLEQPFADELGIYPGGTIIYLTDLGLAVRNHLRGENE